MGDPNKERTGGDKPGGDQKQGDKPGGDKPSTTDDYGRRVKDGEGADNKDKPQTMR